MGGELSLGGVAPSLFGLIHPKNVGSQPQRAVSTNGGQSFVKRNLSENVTFYIDSTSVFVKYFGLKTIYEIS